MICVIKSSCNRHLTSPFQSLKFTVGLIQCKCIVEAQKFFSVENYAFCIQHITTNDTYHLSKYYTRACKYIDYKYIVLSSHHSAYDHAFLSHWQLAASAHIDMSIIQSS